MAVLGIGQSPLEAVLLKRHIMGPSWVSVSKPKRVDTASQVRLHHQNASQTTTLPSSSEVANLSYDMPQSCEMLFTSSFHIWKGNKSILESKTHP